MLYLLAGHAPPCGERYSSEITPAVQRLLERFDDLPVLVYDLAWELVAKNRLGEALTGLATGNIARNHFVGESPVHRAHARAGRRDERVDRRRPALRAHPPPRRRAAARHRRRAAAREPALRGAVEAEPGRGPHVGDARRSTTRRPAGSPSTATSSRCTAPTSGSWSTALRPARPTRTRSSCLGLAALSR